MIQLIELIISNYRLLAHSSKLFLQKSIATSIVNRSILITNGIWFLTAPIKIV
jgi:hypothetical protein